MFWVILVLVSVQVMVQIVDVLGCLGEGMQCIGLVCEVVYLFVCMFWLCGVEIVYDQQCVCSVYIDGILVYMFMVQGMLIFMVLDNECIQIDIVILIWISDFWGLVMVQGCCEWVC